MTVSTASAISGKVKRSMSGIARRIAAMLEPETNPVRKPASSIRRAPMPSPQPGMMWSPGSSRSAFIAAACGRIAFPFIAGRLVSALHQFDADAIGCGDVAQEAAVHSSFQLDGEGHALAAELDAECFEIAPVQEAEMVGPPGVMAGKVGILPNGPAGSGVLTRPLAADQYRHAAEIDKDLRGAARDRIRGDRRAEHLDIPIGRRFRIFADDVHMIEFECGIAHFLPLVETPAAGLRDDTLWHRTECAHASPQRQAFDLLCSRRLSAARAVPRLQHRHQQLRGPRSGGLGEARQGLGSEKTVTYPL